jgi:hypothetical protein
LTASGFLGVALYPLTFVSVPIIEIGFDTILVIIATYYGGELVWRERERKIHEIIDATPLAAWALMLPKMLGLALVMFATLLVGMVVGILVQLLDGGVEVSPGQYLLGICSGRSGRRADRGARGLRAALSPSKYAAGASWAVPHPFRLWRSDGTGASPLPLRQCSCRAALRHGRRRHPLAGRLVVPAVLGCNGGAAADCRASALATRHGTALEVASASNPYAISRPDRAGDRGGGCGLRLEWILIVYNTLVLNSFSTSGDNQRYVPSMKALLPLRRVAATGGEACGTRRALHPEDVWAEVRAATGS